MFCAFAIRLIAQNELRLPGAFRKGLDFETAYPYTYGSRGNVLSITGSKASTLGAANPIRYRGYTFDQETGLYYVLSRHYNPETGRWINVDDPECLGVAAYQIAKWTIATFFAPAAGGASYAVAALTP